MRTSPGCGWGGDHYKWRILRSNAVDEHYITGTAPDREKFQKFAEALPRCIGNPMYHWCHLDEYFRRILCNLIGTWVDSGEYPADMAFLGGLVEDICANNAKRYFNL